MGVRYPTAQSITLVNASIVTTADTIILTSSPIDLPLDAAVVEIRAWVLWTTGAGTTAVTPSIRRGAAVASTKLNLAGNYAVTAAANREDFFMYLDLGALALAHQQYSLSLAPVGATGNATIIDGAIACIVL